jgi:hypothetical protein
MLISLHCQCYLILVEDYEKIVIKCKGEHCNYSLWNFSKVSPHMNQYEAILKKIVVQVAYELVYKIKNV